MKLTKALKVSGLAALLGTAMMGAAHAGTSGTEFQDAYDLILGWLGGYLGRAIALCFFVIGIFMGVARQNLMAGGIAVAAAFSKANPRRASAPPPAAAPAAPPPRSRFL